MMMTNRLDTLANSRSNWNVLSISVIVVVGTLLLEPVDSEIAASLPISTTTTIKPAISTVDQKINCSRDYHVEHCLLFIEMVTSNATLAFPLTMAELMDTCHILRKGDQCTQQFIDQCTESAINLMFRGMIQGSKNVIGSLCKPGQLQTDYLLHAHCFKQVAENYCKDNVANFRNVSSTIGSSLNKFYGRASLARIRHLGTEKTGRTNRKLRTMNSAIVQQLLAEKNNTKYNSTRNELHLQQFCCAYKATLECQLSHIEQSCGPSAVLYFRHYTDQMSNSLLTEHCLDYTYSDRCRQSAVPPTASPLASRTKFRIRNFTTKTATPTNKIRPGSHIFRINHWQKNRLATKSTHSSSSGTVPFGPLGFPFWIMISSLIVIRF